MAFICCNSISIFIAVGPNLFIQSKTESSKDNKCLRFGDFIKNEENTKPEAEDENASSEEPKADKKVSSRADGNVESLCFAMSTCGSLLAVGTSSKHILIFDAKCHSLIRSISIPKASTAVSFDKENKHVVVGDRAGHVIQYSVVAPKTIVKQKDITGQMSEYEGTPLTGTISMILDIALSEDDKYLIAADRDEKLRISRYPQSYVINSFCLGHTAYVSSIARLGQRLFSAGGDSRILEWDMETGKQLAGSSKLAENPVRKIVAFQKGEDVFICAAVENSEKLVILKSSEGGFIVEKEIDVSSPVLDLCLTDFDGSKTICGLNRKGVFTLSIDTWSTTFHSVSAEASSLLEKAKDAVDNYFKNVTHQNMEEYQKRKKEKLEKNLEKKNKRKGNEPPAVAPSSPKQCKVVGV